MDPFIRDSIFYDGIRVENIKIDGLNNAKVVAVQTIHEGNEVTVNLNILIPRLTVSGASVGAGINGKMIAILDGLIVSAKIAGIIERTEIGKFMNVQDVQITKLDVDDLDFSFPEKEKMSFMGKLYPHYHSTY